VLCWLPTILGVVEKEERRKMGLSSCCIISQSTYSTVPCRHPGGANHVCGSSQIAGPLPNCFLICYRIQESSMYILSLLLCGPKHILAHEQGPVVPGGAQSQPKPPNRFPPAGAAVASAA